MNNKHFLRGLGIGILLTTFAFMHMKETETVSEKEMKQVLAYIEDLGYLKPDDLIKETIDLRALLERGSETSPSPVSTTIPEPTNITIETKEELNSKPLSSEDREAEVPIDSPTATPALVPTKAPTPAETSNFPTPTVTIIPTTEPTVTPTPIVKKESGYLITEYSEPKKIVVSSSIYVRDIPNKTGTKLGSFKKNSEIITTGYCEETGWYQVLYKNKIGYISGHYVTLPE